jgi:hypothetical protein
MADGCFHHLSEILKHPHCNELAKAIEKLNAFMA